MDGVVVSVAFAISACSHLVSLNYVVCSVNKFGGGLQLDNEVSTPVNIFI